MSFDSKQHWENIYQTKSADEVSWTQAVPEVSLKLINSIGLQKDAAIIDIGGGDSNLVDHLLDEGYTNLTVLDISSSAIEKAKTRLGHKAHLVKWIVSDILNFNPETTFQLWHDRAAFHFQTEPNAIEHYLEQVQKAHAEHLIIGTFSVNGPIKCSGINIHQYDENSLPETFTSIGYLNEACERQLHTTPFGTTQDFIFCKFKKA
jgi:2-polyprenyl-3-methyl-5-hydroxy-6-metoxy-1,4-benzoquinol methylase